MLSLVERWTYEQEIVPGDCIELDHIAGVHSGFLIEELFFHDVLQLFVIFVIFMSIVRFSEGKLYLILCLMLRNVIEIYNSFKNIIDVNEYFP